MTDFGARVSTVVAAEDDTGEESDTCEELLASWIGRDVNVSDTAPVRQSLFWVSSQHT